MSDFAFYAGNGVSTIISLVLSLALLGAGIFVAVDAGKRPDWAFQNAGSKGLWIGLGIAGGVLGLCCCILGLPVPIIWFAAFRNKVMQAEQGGPYQGFGGPPGGFGGPPPGYGPPPGGGYPPPDGGGFPPPPGGGFPPPPPPPFGQ